MPVDIIVTNPYANPEKGKLFESTEQPFQSADISGLGDNAYTSLYLSNASIAGKRSVMLTGAQWSQVQVQRSLGGMGQVASCVPVSGSTMSSYGIALTSSGGSTPALATTNLQTRTKRTQFDTGTSTTSVVGVRTAYGQWWRGTATGEGGFFFNAVFSQNTNVSGHTAFVGFCATTDALSGTASSMTSMLGIGYDTSDTAAGNWYIMRNDASGTATKVDTGIARNTTSVIEFAAYCKGASGSVTVQVTNRSTSSITFPATAYSTDLPSSTAFLAVKSEILNGSTTSNGGLLLYKLYVESPE